MVGLLPGTSGFVEDIFALGVEAVVAVVGFAAVAAPGAVVVGAVGLVAGDNTRMTSSRLVVPSRTRNKAASCKPGNLYFMRDALYAL